MGVTACIADPCCWILKDEDGIVIGMVTSHVDDFLIAGDASHPRWREFIEELKNTYGWSPWKDTDFVHCGVRIRQLQDYSFILDQEEFFTGIEEIIIERRRSEKEDTPVTEHERTELRGLLGAVQWKAYNTGLELSAQLSILQSQTTTVIATVETLKAANKLFPDMHHHKKQQIVIHAFPVDSEIIMTCWTDAAVANRLDLSSTGAYILGATTKNILEAGGDNVSLISWRSGKLPRQARSSLFAEVQALSEGDQELMYSRRQCCNGQNSTVQAATSRRATSWSQYEAYSSWWTLVAPTMRSTRVAPPLVQPSASRRSTPPWSSWPCWSPSRTVTRALAGCTAKRCWRTVSLNRVEPPPLPYDLF